MFHLQYSTYPTSNPTANSFGYILKICWEFHYFFLSLPLQPCPGHHHSLPHNSDRPLTALPSSDFTSLTWAYFPYDSPSDPFKPCQMTALHCLKCSKSNCFRLKPKLDHSLKGPAFYAPFVLTIAMTSPLISLLPPLCSSLYTRIPLYSDVLPTRQSMRLTLNSFQFLFKYHLIWEAFPDHTT